MDLVCKNGNGIAIHLWKFIKQFCRVKKRQSQRGYEIQIMCRKGTKSLGIVICICRPKYLVDWGKRITWNWEFQAILAIIVRLSNFFQMKQTGNALWLLGITFHLSSIPNNFLYKTMRFWKEKNQKIHVYKYMHFVQVSKVFVLFLLLK